MHDALEEGEGDGKKLGLRVKMRCGDGGRGTTSSGSGSRAYRRDSTLREKILSRRQHTRKMDEHGGGENQTLRL